MDFVVANIKGYAHLGEILEQIPNSDEYLIQLACTKVDRELIHQIKMLRPDCQLLGTSCDYLLHNSEILSSGTLISLTHFPGNRVTTRLRHNPSEALSQTPLLGYSTQACNIDGLITPYSKNKVQVFTHEGISENGLALAFLEKPIESQLKQQQDWLAVSTELAIETQDGKLSKIAKQAPKNVIEQYLGTTFCKQLPQLAPVFPVRDKQGRLLEIKAIETSGKVILDKPAIESIQFCIFDYQSITETDTLACRALYTFINYSYLCELNHQLEELLQTRLQRNQTFGFISRSEGVSNFSFSQLEIEPIQAPGLELETCDLLLNKAKVRQQLYQQSQQDLLEENKQLALYASQDSLTELVNRRYFLQRGHQMFAQSQQNNCSLCLLILDLDHFKKINDNYGHMAGDNALRQFSALCRRHFSPTSLIARMGGEEFVVLIPDTRLQDALDLAHSLCAATSKLLIASNEHSFRFTVSIGLTSAKPGDLMGDMMVRADNALYVAKNKGRNQVCPQ